MKKDTLSNIVLALILVVVFSFWNLKLIEAKEDEGSLGRDAKEEILWLARVIYSETKNANEQVLVAWVVRNRVEAGFHGESYKEVANSKGQFSGLHIRDVQYLHNISRNYDSKGESWQKALEIAEGVYSAPAFMRPFSKDVRHFYSPISLKAHPEWSAENKPALVIRDSNRNIRFAFYESIK